MSTGPADRAVAGVLVGAHRAVVLSVAVTPDGGRVVSGGRDGAVRVWDPLTRTQIGDPFRGHSGSVTAVAVTRDGSRVVSGGDDGTVQVWDLASRTRIGPPLTGHREPVHTVTVTRNGALILSGGEDGTIRLWHLATRAPVGGPLRGHVGAVNSVTVTRTGGRILSGGADGTVRVWNLATRTLLATLTGHDGPVRSVSLTPDGLQVVSGGDDHTVRVWNVATGSQQDAAIDAGSPVRSVTVTPDGTRIIGGGDGVRVWNLDTRDAIGEPLVGQQEGGVYSVTVTPDGTHVLSGGDDGAGDGSVRDWDLSPTQLLVGHSSIVRSVAMVPDGRRAVSGASDGVRVWNLDTRREVDVALVDNTAPSRSVAVSADSIVSGGTDGTIRQWAIDSGVAPQLRSTAGNTGVRSVAVSADGTQVVAGCDDGSVQVWSSATSTRSFLKFDGHTGAVRSVALTPDGAKVVSGGADATVRVWDLGATEQTRAPITGHGNGVRSVVVAPDGTQIVSGSADWSVRLWDLETGDPMGEPLTGHRSGVRSVALTPDGTQILSGGADGTVRIWDRETGLPVGEPLVGHLNGVLSVATSPDGTRIVSGGADGTLRVSRPFGPPRINRDAAVATDAASAVDRLALTADVQTIAALLVAVSTSPPLSVAIMGSWGSGKSTFMRLVFEEVAALSARYRSSQAYATQVRQVRFNAWHFSDDHLWVGLVEHLFRELRRAPDDRTEPGGRPAMAVEAELAAARARQARTDRRLREIYALAPERGWPGRFGGIRRAWLVARAAVADVWQSRSRTVAWSAGFAVIAVAAVAATLVFGDQARQALPGWVLAGAAGVAAVVTPLRRVWQAAGNWSETGREALASSAAERAREIHRLEDELTRLDPARRLDALLADIATAERYAGYRGLTGRIHHDLQRLNEQLVTVARGDPSQQWRIVLYIDDLDRCPPGRVAEVLQAIDLLLSMELFLVVVAVDPRWLVRALQEQHGPLLLDDADPASLSRPLHYLDKIFHVPYAVRPVGGRAADYLRSLLPDPEPAPGPVTPPVPPSPPDPAEQPPLDPPPDRDPEPAPPAGAPPTIADPVEQPPGPVRFESLSLRRAEVEFLPHLADLLPTPRSIKKLTNLYRLLRIGIPDDELDAFLGDAADAAGRVGAGPYQAASLLLATLISAPGDAAELIRQLHPAAPDTDVLDALARHPSASGQRLADTVVALRTTMPVHGATATYRLWAGRVARYSFETYEMFVE